MLITYVTYVNTIIILLIMIFLIMVMKITITTSTNNNNNYKNNDEYINKEIINLSSQATSHRLVYYYTV